MFKLTIITLRALWRFRRFPAQEAGAGQRVASALGLADWYGALQLKWTAGAKKHQGGPESFADEDFDFMAAIAAEALDILNYIAKALQRNADTEDAFRLRFSHLMILTTAGACAAEILKLVGLEAAEQAAAQSAKKHIPLTEAHSASIPPSGA